MLKISIQSLFLGHLLKQLNRLGHVSTEPAKGHAEKKLKKLTRAHEVACRSNEMSCRYHEICLVPTR